MSWLFVADGVQGREIGLYGGPCYLVWWLPCELSHSNWLGGFPASSEKNLILRPSPGWRVSAGGVNVSLQAFWDRPRPPIQDTE